MTGFEKLVDGYLNDALTREQTEELAAMVNGSPELRERFLEWARLEGMLKSRFPPDSARIGMAERIGRCLKGNHDRRTTGDEVRKGIERFRRAGGGERRGYARFGYAALLMVGVAVFSWWYAARRQGGAESALHARLRGCRGTVDVFRRGRTIPSREGLRLFRGDRIRTGDAACAVIQYDGEGTRVDVSRRTDVRFGERDGGKRVELAGGRVELAVDPRNEASALRVITPHAEVSVVGTVFGVAVDGPAEGPSGVNPPASRTRVETYQGEVKVTRKADNSEVPLAEGQLVSLTDSGEREMDVSGISGWDGFQKGAGGEVLRRFRWAFDRGPPRGFLLLQGGWSWKKTAPEHGTRGIMVPDGKMLGRGKGFVGGFPFRVGDKPFKIAFRGGTSAEAGQTYFCMVLLAKEAPDALSVCYRRWWQRKRLGKIDTEYWFQGKRVVQTMSGRRGAYVQSVTESKHPHDRIALVLEKVNVDEIRLREVGEDELPEALRSEASWERLKDSMPYSQGWTQTELKRQKW
jgi:hypothetical protein